MSFKYTPVRILHGTIILSEIGELVSCPTPFVYKNSSQKRPSGLLKIGFDEKIDFSRVEVPRREVEDRSVGED